MLKIKELKKTYPGFELSCDLEVPAGRITGLIGQNGAGKSTLYKCILQLCFADSGRIELFGNDLKEITEKDKQDIGVMLAESQFSSYITIEDAIQIMKCFYDAFDENDFRSKCRQFNLDTKKKIKELSTGMKAKLNVLLALSHKAKILLLDEPTVGLDVLARDDILAMIREYMAEDEERAALISSHISSDLETLCDDFYMIHDGKIILHEETDRLLSDYAILKVSEEEYEKLDRKYLLKVKKEAFGYRCLSDQRQFYMNNYPQLVIERSGIDELIELMLRGE